MKLIDDEYIATIGKDGKILMPVRKFDSESRLKIAIDWSTNQGKDIPSLCTKYDCSKAVIEDAVKKGSLYAYYRNKREKKNPLMIANDLHTSKNNVITILNIAEYLDQGYSLGYAKKMVI